MEGFNFFWQYPELYSLVRDLPPAIISGADGPKQPRCEWMYRKESELNKSRHVHVRDYAAMVVAKKQTIGSLEQIVCWKGAKRGNANYRCTCEKGRKRG